MVVLVLSGEYGHADQALEHYAAEAPHVDGRGVGDSEHDFWSSIEPRLYVSVEPFQLKAAAAVVDQLYLGFVGPDQQHVLRFEVAMDN